MARTILTILLVIIMNVLVGCYSADSGRSQLVPTGLTDQGKTVFSIPAEADEADLVEQLAINRGAYKEAMETLVGYYNKTGNSMKLEWAENELKKLNKVPKYNYIIEASVAGSGLKATASITEANYFYDQARNLEKKAHNMLVYVNDNMLRQALAKYNKLIRKHPSSDKIDDAAYRAGAIYEHFNDYTIAILYYKRAYQWNSKTPYPARFKAAYILDKKLHRRAEALELYKQSVAVNIASKAQIEYAQKRIDQLSSSVAGTGND